MILVSDGGLLQRGNAMLKTMLWGAAIVSTSVLMSIAVAHADPLYVNAVDIDVVPGKIEDYLVAIKEVGAASIKSEPGCSEFDITVSQKTRTTCSSSRCTKTPPRSMRT